MKRTLEIANIKAQRILAAMRSVFPDYEQLTDGQLFDTIIFNYCRNLVHSYESQLAKESKEVEVNNDFKTMT